MRFCTSLRHKIVLLVLTAVLAVPVAGATIPISEPALQANAVELAPLRLLRHAWNLLRSVWSKEGCNIDPDGRCLSSQAPAAADTGCDIDADGRCHS